MLQTHPDLPGQAHLAVFPVKLQETFACLTILIRQLLYSHALPRYKAVLNSYK